MSNTSKNPRDFNESAIQNMRNMLNISTIQNRRFPPANLLLKSLKFHVNSFFLQMTVVKCTVYSPLAYNDIERSLERLILAEKISVCIMLLSNATFTFV